MNGRTVLKATFDLPATGRTHSCHRRSVVQGVVYAKPVDGEVFVFTKISVGKKRVGQIAKFDEETHVERCAGQFFK